MNKKLLGSLSFILFISTLSSCNIFNNLSKNEMFYEGKLNKTTYLLGDNFIFDDIQIYDKKTNNKIEDYSIELTHNKDSYIIDENFEFSTIGDYKINVKKDGYKDLYISSIKVVEQYELKLTSYPSKINYLIGESFDATGLKVTLNNEAIDDYVLSIPNGTILNEIGENVIEISKDGAKSDYFSIFVYEKRSLKIASNPTKTYYILGEELNLDGLKVVDSFENNEITDYEISIPNGTVLNDLGTIEIVISKEDYLSASFEIEVAENSDIGTSKTFTIYSINDTHGQFNRDPSQTSNIPAGMAYIGEYFNNLKSEDNIIMSCGDMWQGGAESNKTHGLIMTEAMNMSKFDAMVIGNHEFDWDEQYIIDNVEIMNFPLLGSNIFYKGTNNIPSYLIPSCIIEQAGVKIGIIGSVLEGIQTSILASISNKFDFPAPNEYIKQESDKLRNEGCDVVILGAHDQGFEGYSSSSKPTKFSDLTEISSVSNKRYVDAMLFGHDHVRKNGIYNGVPYAEAGCNGAYIAKIDFEITKTGKDDWEVTTSTNKISTEIIPAYSTCRVENEEITALKEKYKDQIGNLDEVLYTFTKQYSQSEFAVVVSQAIYWFINNNENIFNREVSMGVHNLGGIRGTVYQGDFTYDTLEAIVPFNNALSIMKCTKYQYNNFKGSSYGYYEESAKQASDGYYYVGTISYVAEKEYATSYIEFNDYIIKDAIAAFFKSDYAKSLNL